MKEKINIMFVGLGSIGQRHLRNLKKILKNNVRFFAFRKSRYTPLLDFNGKKIKGNVEEKYGISVTPNLNLVNKKIHIIFITNPTSLHIATVLKLKNLKNVYIFIEKPLDSSLSKYQDFLKYIKKNNLKIFVGYNLRFHPGFEKLKKIIRIKKEFNKIKYAIFKCGENLKKFHEYENYLISYASNKRLGGGVNLNNSHEIDMMLDLFGNATILNSYKDNLSNLKIDVEDFSVSVYKSLYYKKKIISILIFDFFQENKERYIKLICENKEIFLDLNNFFIKITKKNNNIIYRFIKNKNSMYIKELKFFLNLFYKRKKISDNYNEKNAHRSLRLALKIK